MIGLSPGLLPILPEHVYGQTKNLRTDPRLRQDVVGSGPYELVSFRVGQDVVLKARNDFFLDDVPNLDKIIIKYFNDETTAEVALENGVINFTTPVDPAILTRASEYSALVVSKDGYEALGA